MNDRYPQSALREWWREITHRVTLVCLLGAGVIVAVIGPFGTEEDLSASFRFMFWIVTIVLTYAVASLTVQMLLPPLQSTGFISRTAALAAANCVTVSGTVLLINRIAFGTLPTGVGLAGFLTTLCLIVCVMTAVLSYVEHKRIAALEAENETSVPELAAILTRLPIEKRGALLALSVEDHYVRVRTSAGETMLLMRLSDAMREVGDVRGDQVHRSHWVAFDQVTSVTRKGDRAILTLSDASEIPVSRANLPKLKEAGLLP